MPRGAAGRRTSTRPCVAAATSLTSGSPDIPSAYRSGRRRSASAWRSAPRAQVIRLVMRSGLALVAVGLALGTAGAAAAARLIGQLLFGIEPLNAPVYAAVIALFGLV